MPARLLMVVILLFCGIYNACAGFVISKQAATRTAGAAVSPSHPFISPPRVLLRPEIKQAPDKSGGLGVASAILGAVALLTLAGPGLLFAVGMMYALTGFVLGVCGLGRRRRKKIIALIGIALCIAFFIGLHLLFV